MTRRESLVNLSVSGKGMEDVFIKSPKSSPKLNEEVNDQIATKILFKMDNGSDKEAFDLLSRLSPLLKLRITDVVARTLSIQAWTAPTLEEQQVEAGVTLLFPNS